MNDADSNVTSLQERVRELQSLLAEALPELAAYYDQKKAKIDRSAIHQSNAHELRELINRVARHLGEPPIDD